MNTYELISHIEQTALPEIAASWDASGIQLAGDRQEVRNLAVALDPSEQVVHSALDWGADFVLTHHPLTLKPKLPQKGNGFFKIVSSLMKKGAWLYAAHTSLDSQPNGPVSWLAKDLALLDPEIIEATHKKRSIKLRLPTTEQEAPSLKNISQRDDVLEARTCADNYLEIICWEDHVTQIKELIQKRFSPAWIEAQELLAPQKDFGLGCIGNLPKTLSWKEFAARLTRALGHSRFKCAGVLPDTVSKVAYCPGSGAFLINQAFAAGAQIYITGDLKYHEAQEIDQGLVIDAGHFLLEEIMMQRFALQLKAELEAKNVEVRFFAGSDALQILDLDQSEY
jgi:dinuclear metal center YbgI/SA1388 family protein